MKFTENMHIFIDRTQLNFHMPFVLSFLKGQNYSDTGSLQGKRPYLTIILLTCPVSMACPCHPRLMQSSICDKMQEEISFKGTLTQSVKITELFRPDTGFAVDRGKKALW